LLILKPSKVTLEASAIYSDPGAAERARAAAATTPPTTAYAAEPELRAAAEVLLSRERAARARETEALKMKIAELQNQLAERDPSGQRNELEADVQYFPPAPPSPASRLSVRLLELDLAEAEVELQLAQTELQEGEDIQKRSPGALTDTVLRARRLKVDRAKIQVERIRLKLEAARAEEPSTLPGLQTH
ncbi:MAG: hypothetical protein MUF06_21055, partial [Pirellulaceae bacterium]|nr:hypothetical protein [Pirellulaceae bacterium]